MDAQQTARLRLVAQHRIDAARRRLVDALADPKTAAVRLAFLRVEVDSSERALSDLDSLTIPRPPATPFAPGDTVDVIDLRDGAVVARSVRISALRPSEDANSPGLYAALDCGYAVSVRCLRKITPLPAREAHGLKPDTIGDMMLRQFGGGGQA